MTAEHDSEVRAGLAALAVDWRTLDPLDDDLDDLAPLAGMVGDARIVALGENAHFAHEFSLARHRILRFLVERLGFRAFGLESGLVEGFTVDDWVHGAGGDLGTVLTAGCTNRMGLCEEFGDQLTWMRAHNHARSGSGSVAYFGFDSTGDLIATLGLLIDYFDRVDPDFAGFCRKELMPVAEQWDARVSSDGWHYGLIERYHAMEAAVGDRWSLLLADLELVLADRSLDYIGASSRHDFARAQWRARLCRQFSAMYRNMPTSAYFGPVSSSPTSRNARDVFMLENIEGVLRELGPDARIVLAAHNSHIARFPLAMKGPAREWGETDVFTGTGATMAGQYLGARFGASYVPIAFTARAGHLAPGVGFEGDGAATLGEPAPDSLDALLSAHAHPVFLTDLRRWPQTGVLGDALDAVKCLRISDRYAHTDPRRAFDLALHVDTITPRKALPDEHA